MNPFFYSKVRHSRTRTPPAYARYQQFKSDLKIEFQGQCVYCRAIDRIKGDETFGVDHYRPKGAFPDMEREYLNLYYCCNRCNSFKGRYWPTPKQRALGHLIPNPCEHIMFEHLRYSDDGVRSVSDIGEFAVERLDLNEPAVVDMRRALVDLISLSAEKAVSLQLKIAAAEKGSSMAEPGAERAAFEADIAAGQKALDRVKKVLQTIYG